VRRDFGGLEARRFKAARCFGQGESRAEIAKTLGVSRHTVNRWYHAWREHGRAGLKAAGRAGRKPRLERRQLARVHRALRRGPRANGFASDRWTLSRTAIVIERLTGIRYHPAHLSRLLPGLRAARHQL
jgi:transposase